jgi:type II secretory ATPase GspE/PulE/Tfp pilus assembly ATPase PilB-like protein
MNDELRELITNRASVRDIKATARRNGMQTLRQSAMEKVHQGATTLKEINKVTFREG